MCSGDFRGAAVDSIHFFLRIGKVGLAHLDPRAVLVAPAPEPFRNAGPIGVLAPAFGRRAADGEYWLVDDGHHRLPAVLIGSANPNLPAAVVIPLDADFATRADAA